MKKKLIILLSIQLVILAIGIIISVYNREKIYPFFFNFSLIDLLILLSSSTTGVLLTYIIAISYSKENKKNEIVEEVLSAIKRDLTHIMKCIFQNKGHRINENMRSYLLSLSNMTDKDIVILCNICKGMKHMDEPISDLKEKRANFHYFVTGDRLTNGNTVSDEYAATNMDNYYLIKQSILQCKVKLFIN
ncbi:hypothetical protein [Treponema socranskii]|jgi:hypothetical protein|uniref:hypothetical protein n=1 Tax=Treponema socranskii TaxID=53419 RepID=UPI0028EB4F67|nr:hypothetical protein [Treponema socranskii]